MADSARHRRRSRPRITGDLQAPVASHLRFLLSVPRIVPCLERAHQSVVEIAS
jgi:hypothetical protein